MCKYPKITKFQIEAILDIRKFMREIIINMITNFSINEQNILGQFSGPLEKSLWIDLYEPSSEERLVFEKETNIILPLHHEMHQLEFSNRFYIENTNVYLSISVVTTVAPIPESHVVTFIITKDKLITLRYSDPNPIQTVMDQIEKRPTTIKNYMDIFMMLLGALVGRVADLFELIGAETEGLALTLVNSIDSSYRSQSGNELNNTLREINKLENLISKVYQSLSSLGLLMGYMQQMHQQLALDNLQEHMDTINQDIKSLQKHGDYLNQKLGFQLQSTLGLINFMQTQIIKIFTVLAMVFMPPTLIASIYGMNFHKMPELSLSFGYPLALLAMLISSFLPYRFFKRKGWI